MQCIYYQKERNPSLS